MCSSNLYFLKSLEILYRFKPPKIDTDFEETLMEKIYMSKYMRKYSLLYIFYIGQKVV